MPAVVFEPALFIDFDGVLVDSNSIKVDAFLDVASRFFDAPAAIELVDYHLRNPGDSRFTKFAWLIDNHHKQGHLVKLDQLVKAFSATVLSKVQSVDRCPDLARLIIRTKMTPHILSAAPTDEISYLVDLFGWRSVFESRIHGSPDKKADHLGELGSSIDFRNSIFVGDASTDYQVAQQFGIPFVFVENWSEWNPNAALRQRFHGTWPTLEDYLCSNWRS